MPKIFLNRQEEACVRLSEWVLGQMSSKKVSQSDMAADLGITQQGVSWKVKNNSLTFRDFIYFLEKFDPDEKTIRYLIGN